MLVSNTIRLFLDGIGRSEEYEFYLEKFQSARSPCFSILIPDHDSLLNAGDALRFQLDSLLRLGLCPAILLAGPRAAAMHELLEPTKDKGVPPAREREVLNVDIREGDAPAGKIASAAARARERGGYVILECDSPTPSALRVLIPLIAHRLLFIRMRGALRNEDESDMTLHRVRKNLPPAAVPDQDIRAMALEILDAATEPLHIAVASPFAVLKEIFTVKGAGTILRPGSNIQRFRREDSAGLDKERLRALLTESFGRAPRDFDSLLGRIESFYIEENYRGAILLEKHPAGSYLSKFAVGTQARGDGVAQELWEATAAEHTTLFWRSRARNAINRWYGRLAHGRQDYRDWTIFWRGADHTDIPDIIRFCGERGSDFSDA